MARKANRLLNGGGMLALAAFFAALITCGFPSAAIASGDTSAPLALSNVIAGSDGLSVSAAPSQSWTVALEFNKNVSYADEGDNYFVSQNLSKVSVVGPDGTTSSCFTISGAHDKEDRQVIYVVADEWLLPQSEYTIVVAPGVESKSGEATSCEYRYTFRTDDMCPDGLTVGQNITGAVVVVSLALGFCIAVVKLRRRSR